MNEMTSLERAKAYFEGKPVDRLLCSPGVDVAASRIYGCHISDFSRSGKILAKAQIAAWEQFGYDGINVFTDLFTWCEAMGCTVSIPEDGIPDLKKPVLSNPSEIGRLEPADPDRDKRLPIHVEAMKYLKDQVGHLVDCSATIIGPFTNAFFFLGINETLELLVRDPQVIHSLCRVSLETCKRYAAVVVREGLSPGISDPMCSTSVVSPSVFRTYGLPYLKELISYIHSLGATPSLHICGQTAKIWPDIKELPISGISIDNIADLSACKEVLGGTMRIAGNVDPSGIMYRGTPEMVRRKTLECIGEAYDSPKGYIVMSGCSLPADTPAENIQAMMDTVTEVGYPVTREKISELMRK